MQSGFTIKMRKTGPMEFTTTFDKDFPHLIFDESQASGGNEKYPDASRVLTAAIANCLSASYTFCAIKARIPVKDMETKATCTTSRGEEGYWRIESINVEIIPTFDPDAGENQKTRCQEIFKNYCVVTGSVIQGIDVKVDVKI